MQLVLHTTINEVGKGTQYALFPPLCLSFGGGRSRHVYTRFWQTHGAGETGVGLEVTLRSVSGVSTPSPTLAPVAPATPVFCRDASAVSEASAQHSTKILHTRPRGPVTQARTVADAAGRQTAAADLSIEMLSS